MLRNVITINEDLCDGCGECVTACVEGALQLIDGKAKLISEMYCDGLGACLGNCPQNAISVIQKECEAYNEIKTLQNIVPQGAAVLEAHLKHLYRHGQMNYFNEAIGFLKSEGYNVNIQSLMAAEMPAETAKQEKTTPKQAACNCAETSCEGADGESELQNWPIQMHLVNPMSGSFRGKDLLIAADCVPFALRNFHEVLLKDKAVIIACPKLDSNKEAYLHKLVTMFTENDIASVTVAVMEVPCCSGLVHLVKQAIERSGSTLRLNYKVISIDGQQLN